MRRVSAPIGLALGLALGLACGGDARGVVSEAEPDVAHDEVTDSVDVGSGAQAPAPAAPAPVPAEDCDALARAAAEDDADAYALAMLCPEIELRPPLQHAALMQVADPASIERLLPRLSPGSETAALARLVLRTAPDSLPERLDDPASAIVIPVNDHVLAQAALAHATFVSKSAHPDDRTRAQAYLARVHLVALEGLGFPDGVALPPFARTLAGRAVHHGRTFCTLYWQRRVTGLAGTFDEVEAGLLDAVVALEACAHRADSALVATERERGRSYVLRNEARMEATRAERNPSAPAGPLPLLPLPQRVGRLLDQGFVDLAITITLARGADADGYGLAAAGSLVRDGIVRRSLHEYADKLARRLEQTRARKSPPAEAGPLQIEPPAPVAWPDAAAVQAQAHAWLVAASPSSAAATTSAFARRHALTRAIVLLREDPAAVRGLAALALEDPALRPHAGLLFALVQALDADTLADARLLARVDASWPAPRRHSRDASEARTRTRLALAAREGGLAPR